MNWPTAAAMEHQSVCLPTTPESPRPVLPATSSGNGALVCVGAAREAAEQFELITPNWERSQVVEVAVNPSSSAATPLDAAAQPTWAESVTPHPRVRGMEMVWSVRLVECDSTSSSNASVLPEVPPEQPAHSPAKPRARRPSCVSQLPICPSAAKSSETKRSHSDGSLVRECVAQSQAEKKDKDKCIDPLEPTSISGRTGQPGFTSPGSETEASRLTRSSRKLVSRRTAKPATEEKASSASSLGIPHPTTMVFPGVWKSVQVRRS